MARGRRLAPATRLRRIHEAHLVVRALGLGLGLTLLAPATAMADSLEAAGNGVLSDSVAINSMWVIVAAMVVFFMQAGFAFLEIGFSRGKNAGTIVAKILTNFSIAAIAWWLVASPWPSASGRSPGTTASSCVTTATR